MFIQKWLLTSILENQRNMEKRIKRLELMQLREAQNKISSLKNLEVEDLNESLLTIEEIIDRATEGIRR